MRLTLQGIQDPAYPAKGYALPRFDIAGMRARSLAAPTWAHFGAGNIFRAFPAVLCQRLLEAGEIDTGISVVECYDEEIIRRAFTPYDNLALAVSLNGDGTVAKRVVASVAEAVGYADAADRVAQIMTAPSLKLVTLTITEKGYFVPDNSPDLDAMDAPATIIGKLTKLLHARYRAGARPVAMVSLDNCSHNGDILRASITKTAGAWRARGLVEQGFADWLADGGQVSFPWSMIDKITPRPAQAVIDLLEADGFEDARASVTAKNTYVSGMVNAEACEYLAIEDRFPAGRPPLEKVGVIMADRETVDRIERMKVCTCLNPLHTCLAIFGCLLGYTRICDEMRDDDLRELVTRMGNDEGMPVVTDPGVMSAPGFLREVLTQRFPNPYLPDTPQRIACDTSKKLPVRFGETLKAYRARGRDLSFLTLIPLTLAAYARYLTGVADDGGMFELSPDPNLPALEPFAAGFQLGQPFDTDRLRGLFANEAVFGVNLYDVNLGEKCEELFADMGRGRGAVRQTLRRCLGKEE